MTSERFPVDDELEAALADPDLMARLRQDTARTAFGVARALQREGQRLAAHVEYVSMIAREAAAAREPIARRIASLEGILREIALQHRELTGEKTYTVPGFGKVTTRELPARWEIDTDVLIASLSDDDARLYLEAVPQPDNLRLLRAEFEETLAPEVAEPYPGVRRIEKRVVADVQIGGAP